MMRFSNIPLRVPYDELLIHDTQLGSTLGTRNQLRWATAAIAIFVVTLALRIIHLQSPLVEAHDFRQTQTAISVSYLVRDGISFLDYQTPIFGPPWRVPFEFPVFQVTAAVLTKLTGMNQDLACRVTSLIYFYISAAFLFAIAVQMFPRRRTAWTILLCYVASPHAIRWSRTSMIEFAAVSFALAYLCLLILWLRQPRRVWLIPLAILAGSLGGLTKVTTMAAVAPPMVAVVGMTLMEELRGRSGPALTLIAAFAREKWALLLIVLLLALIPLAISKAWIDYSDHVKSLSPATRGLMSTNLSTWNYGTLSQRLSFSNWMSVGIEIVAHAMTAVAFIACAYGLLIARRRPRKERIFVYSMMFGAVLPVCVFFNLYVRHDYYICAIIANIAFVAGYGIDAVYVSLERRRSAATVAFSLALLLSFLWGSKYLRVCYLYNYDFPTCRLGRVIERVTDPDEGVFVSDFDWSPSILYYSHRRGYMNRDWGHNAESYRMLPLDRYSTFVSASFDHPALALWNHHRLVGQVDGNGAPGWPRTFYVFKVDEPARPR